MRISNRQRVKNTIVFSIVAPQIAAGVFLLVIGLLMQVVFGGVPAWCDWAKYLFLAVVLAASVVWAQDFASRNTFIPRVYALKADRNADRAA